MIILETQRLLLRTWQDGDGDAMSLINQDPQVMRYFPAILSRQETEALIQRIQQHQDKHGFSFYAVELKSTGEMIGFVGLLTVDFDVPFKSAVEIGWRLASQHWNQGYATEAALAVVKQAFSTLGLNELVSYTAKQNQPSQRVMEKIGMQRDPNDDFTHPKIAEDSPLYHHVVYRLRKA